jgi:D-cysteine desulfhydrase
VSDQVLPDDPPRVILLRDPTPVHDLRRFASELRAIADAAGKRGPAAVLMKREDLMPLGLAGNKVRNLEYVLGKATAVGATTLVAAGRPQANHVRLVAAAAAVRGLRAAILMWGNRPAEPGANERLIRMFGAQIHYSATPEGEKRGRVLQDLVDRIASDGERPVAVDEWIRGPLGARGAVRAALEAIGQATDQGAAPSFVYCAVATGGTVAGLSVGLDMAGSPARLVGVPTHLAGAPSGSVVLERIAATRGELLRAHAPAVRAPTHDVALDPSDWEVYGTSEAATRAALLLGRTEGIAIDPIYTARTVAAVITAAQRGELSGAEVLLLNGGGIPAIFEALR